MKILPLKQSFIDKARLEIRSQEVLIESKLAFFSLNKLEFQPFTDTSELKEGILLKSEVFPMDLYKRMINQPLNLINQNKSKYHSLFTLIKEGIQVYNSFETYNIDSTIKPYLKTERAEKFKSFNKENHGILINREIRLVFFRQLVELKKLMLQYKRRIELLLILIRHIEKLSNAIQQGIPHKNKQFMKLLTNLFIEYKHVVESSIQPLKLGKKELPSLLYKQPKTAITKLISKACQLVLKERALL